jgi:hypothetical protein
MASKRQNNKRRFPDGSGRRPDNSKHKREEAVERQTAYDALNASQKIALLDSRLGVGVGAKKQRAKLAGVVPVVVEGKV